MDRRLLTGQATQHDQDRWDDERRGDLVLWNVLKELYRIETGHDHDGDPGQEWKVEEFHGTIDMVKW